jgi:hypothetical protein
VTGSKPKSITAALPAGEVIARIARIDDYGVWHAVQPWLMGRATLQAARKILIIGGDTHGGIIPALARRCPLPGVVNSTRATFSSSRMSLMSSSRHLASPSMSF